MDEWVLLACKDINSIEPSIAPTREYLDHLLGYAIVSSEFSLAYLQLCKQSGSSCSHVLIVPWLKRVDQIWSQFPMPN